MCISSAYGDDGLINFFAASVLLLVFHLSLIGKITFRENDIAIIMVDPLYKTFYRTIYILLFVLSNFILFASGWIVYSYFGYGFEFLVDGIFYIQNLF